MAGIVRRYQKQNLKIAPHFNLLEFACKDGSDLILLDDELIDKIEILRNMIDKPIKIISGYRTEAYNKQINGATHSYHCKGQAVDIKVDGLPVEELAIYGARLFNGIILYKDFVHLDTRYETYIHINK